MKILKNYKVIFLIITLVQVMIIVFWGTKKENLYWDEFYTLERAHYFVNENDHYIDYDPDYKLGEWLPVSFISDTLIVKENESLLSLSPLTVLKKLTREYNYSAYLNLAESVISPGKFSIWPSILLNIMFFLLNQIVLYALCRKLSTHEAFPLIVCALYGFGRMCISMAVFIRFYMLVTLLVSLFTYLHILYYERDGEELSDRAVRIVLMVLAFAILYLAHNNAQYAVIYGGILVVTFAVLLFVKKGIKRFLYYTLPMFGGGFAYLYTQTDYLKLLFGFRSSYQETTESAVAATLEGIVDYNILDLPRQIYDMGNIIAKYIFGSILLMLIVFVVLVVAFARKMEKKTDGENTTGFSPAVVVPVVPALAYIIIFTVFGLYAQVRYVSFVFPELAIFVIALIFMAFGTDRHRYVFVTGMIVLLIVGVNARGKVDMLYRGDRESIERIRDFGADSYLLNAGNHRTFMSYEIAYVAESDDDFFVYDEDVEGAVDNLQGKLRDKMILVGYYGVPTDGVQKILIENGYQIEWLADTYNYVFFTAVR